MIGSPAVYAIELKKPLDRRRSFGRFFSRRPPPVTMTSVLPPERGGDGGQRPVGSRRAGLPFEFLWTALLTIGRTASTHLGLWTLTST
jgi:hypothetical protein